MCMVNDDIFYCQAVKVDPKSFKHDPANPNCVDNEVPMSIPGRTLKQGDKIPITYTYSYKFRVNIQITNIFS